MLSTFIFMFFLALLGFFFAVLWIKFIQNAKLLTTKKPELTGFARKNV
jgi:hypothetical protein